jgi:hypothetical protein
MGMQVRQVGPIAPLNDFVPQCAFATLQAPATCLVRLVSRRADETGPTPTAYEWYNQLCSD